MKLKEAYIMKIEIQVLQKNNNNNNDNNEY